MVCVGEARGEADFLSISISGLSDEIVSLSSVSIDSTNGLADTLISTCLVVHVSYDSISSVSIESIFTIRASGLSFKFHVDRFNRSTGSTGLTCLTCSIGSTTGSTGLTDFNRVYNRFNSFCFAGSPFVLS